MLEKPYVPKLIACIASGDAKLKEAAHNALTSLQRYANFRNDKGSPDVASWKAWHARLLQEEETMEKIWDICDKANEVYQSREATKYKAQVKQLRKAVAMYGDLIDLGSKSNYDWGDYGINTIRQIMSVMSKTSQDGGDD